MSYWEKAIEIKEETIRHRRHIHGLAEVGLELPKTVEYVMQQLRVCGIEPKKCGKGVVASVGSGEKSILLRADMDALPLNEENNLDFKAVNGNNHACGHDFHAAMLLSAAKLLKENEKNLKGTVIFMFQPAEETFEGSRNMLENGLLEEYPADAALAYHVGAGKMPVGMFMYNESTTMMYSNDFFKIKVQGKGAHGAYPEMSIDSINILMHIYMALQEVIARETDPKSSCVLTVGKISAGNAANIIPDKAFMEGTIRTNNESEREKIKRRVKEIVELTAKTFRGEAEVEFFSEVPMLKCNEKLTGDFVSYMKELPIPGLSGVSGIESSASDDFARITEKMPATYMYLSAGFEDERGDYGAHNPKVQFNEDVCPIGVACLAHCAERWLEENSRGE